jgi:transposase, IS30 family
MAYRRIAYPQSTRRAFWRLIVQGVPPGQAAIAVGAADHTGSTWVREAGGMVPLSLHEPSGRYLSMAEREEIAILHAQQTSCRAIAKVLRRAPSTISQEIRRNGPSRSDAPPYRASLAHAKAEVRARRPKISKLAINQALHDYVQAKLSGREHWSPEQISYRLRAEFPDDEHMRISDESIYRSLYVQSRGGLRRELTKHLRTGRSVRKPTRRIETRGRRVIAPELKISARPAEVADRAIPGHWEGDLIVGTNNKSVIGTLVERNTRFVMLLHLPGGGDAHSVREAIATTITTLPAQLRRSLTWDRGKELADNAGITIDTGLDIYFCDPRSPWQRGTNENTNGLLRQYFPKATNLAMHDAEELHAVATALNGRPRKTLDWKTPGEAMAALLSSATSH